ncbi:hypothetical protein [Methylobacterium segetis]|uniref:hypothetical protein n=1 Tax=Methylobacterium segetis TaxID=2488750 RepID=UPI00104B0B16|nr:hypothetical protein [Methylobacterium segetis]
MPLKVREFHRAAKGPVNNDEDWWRLVLDDDAGQIHVEHEWAHRDVRRSGKPENATRRYEINEFLAEVPSGRAQLVLMQMLKSLMDA